jgi:wyosine [tRNA(Phe)-imidazoG37] synthetase (radical SAM superfamily)
MEAVVEAVSNVSRKGAGLDIVTLAGSGEPTLYARLGELADRLREVVEVPLLLITNGTLLYMPDVADEASRFDLIAPSLDAGDEETFKRLNRPHPELNFQTVLDGLRTFVSRNRGKVRLEVFLARGVNDDERSIAALIDAVAYIKPDAIDLNTAVRPTPGRKLEGVSQSFLISIADRFSCPATPIAAFTASDTVYESGLEELAGRIMESLQRRPATMLQVATAHGVAEHAVIKALTDLLAAGKVIREIRGDESYFVAQS